MARVAAALDQDAKIIGLVCFPHTMSHFYYLALPPMFPALKAAFDLTNVEVASVMSVFAMVAFLIQTPIGFLVDRIGARQVLVAGLTLEAAAIGAMGLVTEFWMLFPLAAIAGLGHTVFHPADYAIMSARISEHRMGRAFGVHSFTGYLGFTLAPIFMGGVTALWNWQTAFLAAGAIGLVAALLVWVNGSLLDPPGDTPVGETADRKAKKKSSDPMTLSQGVRLLFTFPILMCSLYFVFHQLGGGGPRTFLIVALDDLWGVPQVIGNTALTFLMAGTAAGILSGGFVADRFGPQITTAFLTLVPSALLLAMIGWVDLPTVLMIAAVTMSGFLMGLLIPSRDLMLRSVTPDGSMGKVMGFASTGSNLGGALIPLIIGYAIDTAGPEWAFWLSAVFVACAFLTFITVRGKSGD